MPLIKGNFPDCLVGMKVKAADKMVSAKGYKAAFFKDNEKVDVSECDRNKEWIVMIYNDKDIVISQRDL